MNFNEKYPEVKKNDVYEPSPEVWIYENLVQTWRLYPCDQCRNLTGWRCLIEGDTLVPACSEECCNALSKGQDAITTNGNEEVIGSAS